MKYLRDGRQVEVVYQNDEVIFVQPFIEEVEEYDSLYPVFGPIEQVDKVYDKPPTAVLSNEIKGKKEKLAVIREKIREASVELHEMTGRVEAARKENEEVLNLHTAMRDVALFLNRKANYFVSRQYWNFKIETINAYEEGWHDRAWRDIAKIGATVKKNGKDPQVTLSIRDEDGDFKGTRAFETKEEALEYIKEGVQSLIDSGYEHAEGFAKHAIKSGVEAPKDWLSFIESKKAEENQKQLEKRKAELAKMETEIRLLESASS